MNACVSPRRGAGPIPALCLATALAPLAGVAGQIDSATFFQLRRGMTQSEVLLRAGRPDLVTSPGDSASEVETSSVVPRDGGGFDVVRRRSVESNALEEWHYVPDRSEADPFVTVIRFRRGEVWDMDRTKVFTRSNLPEPAAAAAPSGTAAVSDEELRLRRIDRTLRAAEAYAETRARIKQRSADLGEAPADADAATIYRSRRGDGTVYYGDRPPESPGGVVDVD